MDKLIEKKIIMDGLLMFIGNVVLGIIVYIVIAVCVQLMFHREQKHNQQ